MSLVTAKEDALDKHDLRDYSMIFLINVPQLSESQVAKLEAYIREGGGVGVFLGPKVNKEAYTSMMYKDGKGFFPVPLTENFTPPMTDEQKLRRALVNSRAKQILLRDNAAKMHPAISSLYTNERGDLLKDPVVELLFFFPRINQHWPVSRMGKWREEKSVQELYCLPNEQPISSFEPKVENLRKAVQEKYGEPKFEKFRAAVDSQFAIMHKVCNIEGNLLTALAREMDRFLADEVNERDPNEALFREFWGQPEMSEPLAQARALRDSCKYGDPLYLAKKFENGRVAVMTTDAGGIASGATDPWTDWPWGEGYPGWVVVMKAMQKYLGGGGAEVNRAVGSPYSLSLENGRYKPAVGRTFITSDTSKQDRAKAPLIREDLKEQTLDSKDGALKLDFADTQRPGVYIFTLTPSDQNAAGPGIPARKPEYIAVAYNVDAASEGALQRAKGNDLTEQAKGAELHSYEDSGWLESLKQKQTDLSSGRWIYLVILLVLILEQAMAVRLSYHTRPDDLESFAPSAAAAFSHGTAPPAATAEAGAATAEAAT